MIEDKQAELFTAPTGRLIRSGKLPDILQEWRTFSKTQTEAVYYLKCDGKIYAGAAIERLAPRMTYASGNVLPSQIASPLIERPERSPS